MARELGRHAVDLTLGHAGEERQRDRAGSDVLADGELSRPVAETFSVEAHQVDRGQVGLALNPARRERPHGLIAIHPGRQLHDEHEPAAAIAAGIGAGKLEPLDAGKRREVQRGDPRPIVQHRVQMRELRDPERACEIRQPVVEAEPVVIEPAHVRRAALVSLGVDPHLDRGIPGRDHPALAGRQLLVGVEAEHRRVASRTDRHSVGVHRAERLAGVLDDRQPQALERRDVGRIAEDVHRQQRRRPRADRGARRGWVDVQGRSVDVGEHGRGTLVDDCVGARHERERARHDFVAVADAGGAKREMQAGGADSRPRSRARPEPAGERSLELRQAWAQREMARAQHR